jgi:hypothetical protein
MSFQISALPQPAFAALFELDDAALARHGARNVQVTAKPGFPCRVSLADAEIGETVILAHFEHQPADTPFRASHAVYVRRGVAQARPEPGAVPAMLRSRILSLRGFDAAGMLVAAELSDGRDLEAGIDALFAAPEVAYGHIHFAKPGCYAARVDRLSAA